MRKHMFAEIEMKPFMNSRPKIVTITLPKTVQCYLMPFSG